MYPEDVIRVSSINLTAKIILFTSVLLAEQALFPKLYHSAWPLVLTSITLTLVGVIADLVLVPPFGNIPALSMGWFGMTFIIWFIALWFAGSRITLVDAWFMSIPLGPIEYVLHRYVLDSLVR